MAARWVRRHVAAVMLAMPLVAAAPGDTPQHFASPEAAVDALVAAVHAEGATQLTDLFGKDGADVVDAGDPVVNKSTREKFVAAYEAKHSIDTTGETATLSVGEDDWPFPIPLKHTPQGWFFDVAAG